MPTIKVSVILTTYNRPAYLKLAIEAVLSQSYQEFEFIIFDNGSESETEELIKSYTDKRIKCVRNNINSRDIINSFWSLSNCEYLLITHDDDIMKKDMLEKELAILEYNPDITAVSCNTSLIDTEGNIIKEKSLALNSPLKINQFEYGKYYLTESIYITFPTMLMRKSFFINNNLIFESHAGPGADTYLWMKANLLPSSFYILDEPLYYYRIHDKQDSVVNNLSLKLDLYEALFNLFKAVSFIDNFSLITKILLKEYIKNYYHKFVTKQLFIYKIDKIITELKILNNNKLLIIAFIYKYFSFVFEFYYRLLLYKRMISSKTSSII